MNNSIDNQIELVKELIASLGSYSELMEDIITKYQKHITALDANGLVEESVKNLNDNYFENTKAKLNKLVNLIHNNDMQDAKIILNQLEELKNSANRIL